MTVLAKQLATRGPASAPTRCLRGPASRRRPRARRYPVAQHCFGPVSAFVHCAVLVVEHVGDPLLERLEARALGRRLAVLEDLLPRCLVETGRGAFSAPVPLACCTSRIASSNLTPVCTRPASRHLALNPSTPTPAYAPSVPQSRVRSHSSSRATCTTFVPLTGHRAAAGSSLSCDWLRPVVLYLRVPTVVRWLYKPLKPVALHGLAHARTSFHSSSSSACSLDEVNPTSRRSEPGITVDPCFNNR